MNAPRWAASALTLLSLSACRSTSTVVVSTTASQANVPTPSSDALPGNSRFGWTVETREHVDLWLHAFALLRPDSSLVPTFALGYADEVQRAKQTSGTRTLLDANAATLAQRQSANSNLLSAQFLALYFASYDDLRVGCERFLRDEGNIAAAESPEEIRMYATLRTYFSTAGDREWLRLFLRSIADERAKFFLAWWRTRQQESAAFKAAAAALWSNQYAALFSPFLVGSNQRQGRILLSPVVSGEGRALALGRRDNFFVVGLPTAADRVDDVWFTFAHEAVGSAATAAVRDNATLTDEREGRAGEWGTLAPVRGGALLLKRVAPQLVEGYYRYYLTLARQRPGGDLAAQFARIYPLPDAILSAMDQQIARILGGI